MTKQIKFDKPTSCNKEVPSLQEINRLVLLFNEGKYPETVTLAQSLTKHFPLHGFSWMLLGAAFIQLGRIADALAPMQKAAALSPNDAVAHSNLGNVLRELGSLDESEASCRLALKINPNYAGAHYNLGNSLREMGRLDESETSFRRSLEIKPDLVEAYINLGVILRIMSRDVESEASFRRALNFNPNHIAALNNLASLLVFRGELTEALNIIKRSLKIKETLEAKSIFINCIGRMKLSYDDEEIRDYLVRALNEPWARPGSIFRIGINMVKLDPDICGYISRAANSWPKRLSEHDLFGTNGLSLCSNDSLLCALLKSAPICNIEMEHFLTLSRHAMLDAAARTTSSDGENGPDLRFYSALACQCFINEYVFFHTEAEIKLARELKDLLSAALETATQIPALWLVTVASYFPLYSLPFATRLLESEWPEEVEAVLLQQILEPAEEKQIRNTIPRLNDIEDKVSLLVKNQYEENPYPRWIKVAPIVKAKSIFEYLRIRFPLAALQGSGKCGKFDLLIAGSGTGQQSIQAAQGISGARVLAVDLSMNSLAYAKRKTRELGLTTIEYAQADLLKLGSLGRSFDVIESVGVLHHLADPWTGWQVLLSLLRPGGFMKLGFYSKVARRNIVRIRNIIVEQGYETTDEGIRRCRQDLLELDNKIGFGTALKSPDYFSISTCRDLLFHVQEHQMTLTGIDTFLREHNLVFLGFVFEPGTLHVHKYKQRFPYDRSATNLGQWQIFENEYPDTFSAMYQFWIQKVG